MLINQRGSSLVELLIAMLISLIVLLGMISVTVMSVKNTRNNLQIMRLNQELRSAMNIMISEIQRAGYWSNAQSDVQQNRNTNPFMASGTDINISNTGCILFTYDRNNDGSLPAAGSGNDDERYGFRLINSTLQARPASATFSCTSTSGDGWEEFTDSNVVTITNLQFTPVPSTGYQVINLGGTATLTVREIQVSITGYLTSDPTVTRTLVENVRVQNDKFAP